MYRNVLKCPEMSIFAHIGGNDAPPYRAHTFRRAKYSVDELRIHDVKERGNF